MTINSDIKQEVRNFYDSVGWQEIGDGLYQNARYEDLRPVSQEYLHRCHTRVSRHLPDTGRFMLDAGSGPIQYPEYLTYSDGFQYRVCLDISHRALTEARKRIGGHGLFVVGDVAKPPFRSGVFEGVVSLHTVHHLPAEEHGAAFRGFERVAVDGGKIAVVYSWGADSPFMRLFQPLIGLANRLIKLYRRVRGLGGSPGDLIEGATPEAARLLKTPGTFTFKHDFRAIREELSDLCQFEILVWRSVSPAFLRAFIHRPLLGKVWLRMLFWLEELFPRFLGRIGQYPLIVYSKPVHEPVNSERASR